MPSKQVVKDQDQWMYPRIKVDIKNSLTLLGGHAVILEQRDTLVKEAVMI